MRHIERLIVHREGLQRATVGVGEAAVSDKVIF